MAWDRSAVALSDLDHFKRQRHLRPRDRRRAITTCAAPKTRIISRRPLAKPSPWAYY
jgi:hypothetical protein